MMREKPKLDRWQVLANEASRQRDERKLREVLGELGQNEYLGTPVRVGRTIMIPVMKQSVVAEEVAAPPA